MKRIILGLVVSLFFSLGIKAQCTVNATSSVFDTSVCGNCISLTAFGKGQGVNVLSENFNSGGFTSPGWAASVQANWNNPCSTNGVNGTTHIWMGNSAPVPRAITTKSFDFTTATAGVTICFDMLYATQGDNSPCEGPDEPQEGVHLQYSIDGGNTWIDMQYWDPNGGTDPGLVNWNNHCVILPASALTSNTKIRWFQDADSGADYDHWGIDNVNIYVNDPTYNITWTHDSYSYGTGNPGGANPNKVCPKATTTYKVVMTNGTLSCTDSVKVIVKNPSVLVNAGRDTTICSGQCVNLAATAKVVEFPAKIATYSNISPDTVSVQSLGGLITQGASVDINIRTLNMPSVLPNSILSVCVDKIKMQGLPIFSAPASSLKFYLRCPDSTLVLLKDTGDVTGTTGLFGYTTVFNGTCFVPAGGSFPSSTSPYTGNYTTKEPFNGMTGCTSNGIWSLVIVPTGTNIGTTIVVTGWSITFDDPDKSYPATFVWSPTTNMTGANTLTPNVCPTGNATYTLTASDTAGCVTLSDNVTVTVKPICCNIGISASAVQPACGASNGSINLTLQGTGPYTFLWNDNNTSQNRTGLAAGTYRVTITDQGQSNCTKDTVITLSNPGTLSLSLTNPVNPTCGTNNGSITVGLSGGTPGYTVLVDNGIGTPQSINVPVPISQAVSNLPAGNYTITATDAAGCVQIKTVTLTAPNSPTLNSITPTSETCAGSNDGSVSVSVSGGNGTLTYSWSNSQSGSVINNLAPGAYSVTITDASNCSVSASTIIAAGPVCCNISFASSVTTPLCGNSNGSIDFSVVSGSGNYSFSWSNGGSTEDLSNLGAGSYTVTVNDIGQGCSKDTTIIVNNANGPAINSITSLDETCAGSNDGSVSVTASGGTGVLSYSWSNRGTTANISSLSPGQYTITVLDATNCAAIGNAVVAAGPACCNLSFGASVVNPTCENSDGSIDIRVISGSGNYGFVWSNSANSEDISNLPIGTYNVTVTDISQSCFRDTVLVLIENCGCEVAFPTAFSPNKDGINDYFGPIYDCSDIKSASFRVFNRWGEKVFETSDIYENWDGKYKGIIQPLDVYIYYLDVDAIENNKTKTIRLMGNVTIIK